MNQRLKKTLIFSVSALMFLSVSTGLININTNVHADNVPAFLLKENAEDQKSYNAYEKKHFDVPYSEKMDLFSLKNKEYISPESAKNPTVHTYLNNHGFSNATINKYTDTPTKEKEIGDKATEEEKAEDKAFSKSHNSAVTKTHHAKRTHLSKSMSRKIMKQIRLDKKAIRNDKKHLSSRNARKFMRNYTKRSKKRIKGAKRYARYYKDEVKHEKDLVRLTKSIKSSKPTKHHARKSLKHVRKYRKHMKK